MIILASASPARSRLLTEWGISHQIIPSHIDEQPYQQSIADPKTLVETLAKAKASSLSTNHCPPSAIILAADTVVVLNRQIIGKPQDRADAKRIITLLQANTHQVWTGVCLLKPPRLDRPQAEKTSEVLFSDTAFVTFKSMTDSDIETYLDSNDWIGAAGAYRIQQSIKPYIENIDGDLATIIGLPKTLQNL